MGVFLAAVALAPATGLAAPGPFSLSSPANGAGATATPTLEWGYSYGATSYEVDIDGAASATVTPNPYNPWTQQTYTVPDAKRLADGFHTWLVKALDDQGGVATSSTWSFKVDGDPPAAFSIQSPTGGAAVTAASPSFSWQASSDSGSGLDHYVVTIDGVDSAPVDASQTSASEDIPMEMIGRASFANRCEDWAPNSGDGWGCGNDVLYANYYDSLYWTSWWFDANLDRNQTFDLRDIGAAFVASEVDPQLVHASRFNEDVIVYTSGSVTRGIGGRQDAYQPVITFDSSTPSAWGAFRGDMSSFTGFATTGFALQQATADTGSEVLINSFEVEGLPKASHTWHVTAYDKVGNVTMSDTGTFYYEPPPRGFLLKSPADGGCVNTVTPQVCWGATTGSGAPLASYALTVDGTRVQPNLDPTTTCATVPASLAEGAHTWAVDAVDEVGATRRGLALSSEPTGMEIGGSLIVTAATLHVDLTPPVIADLGSPVDGACESIPTPSLCGYYDGPSWGCGVPISFDLLIDGVVSSSSPKGGCQTPAAPLSEGRHSWAIREHDQAGNTADSAVRTLWIDFGPPSAFDLVSPSQGDTLYPSKFSWTPSTDSGGLDHYDVWIDGELAGSGLDPTKTSWSPTTVPVPGSHSWYVVATDHCGNTTQTPTVTFTALACDPGSTVACDGNSTGICTPGTKTCSSAGAWGSCEGTVGPQPETCDGKDDDCDGTVDGTGGVPLSRSCYDGPSGTENVGVCHGGTQTCSGGSWSTCSGEVLPKTETCDGLDDDCDGTVDGTAGVPLKRSCYDGPAGTENVGICRAGTQTCSMGTWGTCVGEILPTSESCDGQDDDCDGTVDGTAGVPLSRSCYDGPAGTEGVGSCRSGAQTCTNGTWSVCAGEVVPTPEVCNGLDDNCDGQVDDGFNVGAPCTVGVGACQASGQLVCDPATGGTKCDAVPGQPKPETCDGKDDDCDGTVDGTAGVPLSRSCYDGPSGTENIGVCRSGTQTCGGGEWSACTGEVLPTPEVCDGLDDDCNGLIDDGIDCATPTDGGENGDAGFGADAGAQADGGANTDGGRDAGSTGGNTSKPSGTSGADRSAGCGCGAAPPGELALLILALVFVWRRRRLASAHVLPNR